MTIIEVAAQALGSIDQLGAMAQAATGDALKHTADSLTNLGSVDLSDDVGGSCICSHIFHF